MTVRYDRYLLVSGKLDDEDHFAPTWWVTAPPEMVRDWSHVPSDEWSVTALRGDDEVARAGATITETPVCRSDRLERRLAALLAVPEGTTAIAVQHGARAVYRRDVPLPARVTVRAVPRQLPRGPVQIDIDGRIPEEGSYLVLRWELRGTRATPLAFVPVARRHVTADVDLTDAPGGPEGRLVAVYHDGVRTETGALEGLELPPRPAGARIVLPLDGMRLSEEGSVPLEGELEGDGAGEQMQWLVDGVALARGARAGVRLPAGPHRIVLRYGEDEVGVSIEVVSETPDAQMEPILPPWRTRPAQVIASALPGAPDSRTVDRADQDTGA
jgi:hypothetical protein